MAETRVIDPWVNVNMGAQAPPEWLVRVKEDYFKAGDDFLRELSADELIAQMHRRFKLFKTSRNCVLS